MEAGFLRTVLMSAVVFGKTYSAIRRRDDVAAVQRLLRAIPFIWAAFSGVECTTEFLARGRERGRVSNTSLSLLRFVTWALYSTWVVPTTLVIVGGLRGRESCHATCDRDLQLCLDQHLFPTPALGRPPPWPCEYF